jgi:hypothetical protein
MSHALARALAAVSLVVMGCSSSGPAPETPEEDAAIEDASPETSGSDVFDLDVTVEEKLPTGEPASTFLFLAVRDVDTKELIGFAYEDTKLVGSLSIKKTGALLRGHRYEVGAKDTWYAGCEDAGSNVWYREIPSVADHVKLTMSVRPSVDVDKRGCDVLHQPVALPSGTYATTAPPLGISGNEVVVVVSPSGRLYVEHLRVFCGTTSSCVSTSVSHAACELEQSIYPGETTFSLGDQSASHTTVKGEAVIDPATNKIRYKGRVYTWTGSSSVCCDQMFDVELVKTKSDTAGCL